MPFTTNKYLELPNNGDYVDTWNVPVNGDMVRLDAALGGVTNLNATSGNATLTSNVSLTTNYINSVLNVTGAMSANVTYTIPSGIGGSWIVRNATTDSTGGPWFVTIASAGGGSNVTVIRGRSSMVWSDGTNIRDVSENIPSIGTVTSVDVSGGTTGLTTSGGPITTNGTITIAGTLATTNGGTGLTSFAGANSAIYATSNSALTSGTLPIEAGGTGITSLGTGVQTALGANVTGSGGIVLETAPNIANAAISNSTINGSVIGGTTPAAGSFTTISASSTISGNSSVSDNIGNVRTIVINNQTGAYVLTATDNGKAVSITTGGVTVPAGVFSAGQNIVIINNSASNQTITQGANATMYFSGLGTTGNRTLGKYGMATVMCIASNTFVISGSGLS